MKKQFIRMFFSIITIAFVMLILELFSLLYASYSSIARWPNYVISEYMNSIVSISEENKEVDERGILNLLFEQIPDTISGLLIRDANEKYTLMYGSSPRGRLSDNKSLNVVTGEEKNHEISLLISLDSNNFKAKDNYFVKKVNTFTLAINTDGGLKLEVRDDRARKIDYITPGFISPKDIAGRVYIEHNGRIAGSFDVIIYGVTDFGPTIFLLKQAASSFILFLPLAFIIAILLALMVSRKSSRQTLAIKEALRKLSYGEYDFTLPLMKSEELNEIGKSLTKLKEALILSEKSRHEWLLSISHDLYTPVTSLQILYEGLRDKVFALDDNLLDSLKKEIDTLAYRISAISYYTNLRLNTGIKEVETFDLKDLITETKENFPSLVLEREDISLVLKTDMAMFSRLLLEIFKNMDEYSEDKKGRLDIRIDNEIVIEFRNRGKLVEPCDDYFDLFKRGDVSRHNGGSGCGLAIIKRSVELNSGKVSIRNEDGNVVLSLSFPLSLKA